MFIAHVCSKAKAPLGAECHAAPTELKKFLCLNRIYKHRAPHGARVP